jgi:hypothetical protein
MDRAQVSQDQDHEVDGEIAQDKPVVAGLESHNTVLVGDVEVVYEAAAKL